jgi:predicted enzyme related to lactoylglutathione lyase
MAIFADPNGAVFGVWQAGVHQGAEVVNEPGSFTWSELLTRDVDKAKRFYGEAFGLEPSRLPDGRRTPVHGAERGRPRCGRHRDDGDEFPRRFRPTG